MAQQTQVTLIDDLDGGAANGSVTFGLDGQTYEIDLSTRNADALFEIFTPYLEAARRMTNPSRGRPRAFTRVATAVDPSAVRAWAASNGIDVSSRGRVSGAAAGAAARSPVAASPPTPWRLCQRCRFRHG